MKLYECFYVVQEELNWLFCGILIASKYAVDFNGWSPCEVYVLFTCINRKEKKFTALHKWVLETFGLSLGSKDYESVYTSQKFILLTWNYKKTHALVFCKFFFFFNTGSLWELCNLQGCKRHLSVSILLIHSRKCYST